MLEVLTLVVVIGVAGVIINKCNKGKKEKTQDEVCYKIDNHDEVCYKTDNDDGSTLKTDNHDEVSYKVDNDHICNCSHCSGNCGCHKKDSEDIENFEPIDELDGCGDDGNEFDEGVEDKLEINDEDEYEAEYKISDDIDELHL